MMGGLGPPLAETKLTYEQFLKTVREGRGMMPATPASKTSDEELRAVYNLAQQTRLDIAQVPLSYKVGQWLTTTRVAVIFTIITLVALVFTIRVVLYWVDCAGWKYLKPYVRRFGYGRALGVFLRSLIVDGPEPADVDDSDGLSGGRTGLCRSLCVDTARVHATPCAGGIAVRDRTVHAFLARVCRTDTDSNDACNLTGGFQWRGSRLSG